MLSYVFVVVVVLWIIAHLKTSRPDGILLSKLHPFRRLMAYIMPTRNESVVYFDQYIDADQLLSYLEEAKKKFYEIIKNAEHVCIWGASGKGVLVLSEFSEELLEKVKFVIDINPTKQGKYLPLSGKLVASPNILKNHKGQLFVIVMNEIYQNEIKKNISSMGVDAIFINSTFGSL